MRFGCPRRRAEPARKGLGKSRQRSIADSPPPLARRVRNGPDSATSLERSAVMADPHRSHVTSVRTMIRTPGHAERGSERAAVGTAGSNPITRDPELPAPIVHVPIGPADDLGLGPEPEPVQDDLRRLRHRLLGRGHDLVDRVGRPLDQQGIMDRGDDGDPPLRRQATGQPQHLGPVRLAREVPEATAGWRRARPGPSSRTRSGAGSESIA